MIFADLAQAAIDPTNQSIVGGGVTAILAGVVVWLAKSYRDDMAGRALLAAEAHAKMVAEFKAALTEQRSDFRAELASQRADFRAELTAINTAVDGLTKSVHELTTQISELQTAR